MIQATFFVTCNVQQCCIATLKSVIVPKWKKCHHYHLCCKLQQHVAWSRHKFNFLQHVAATCNTCGNMHNSFQLAMQHCCKTSCKKMLMSTESFCFVLIIQYNFRKCQLCMGDYLAFYYEFNRMVLYGDQPAE